MNEYESPTAIIKRVGIYLGTAVPIGKQKLIDHLQYLEACRWELTKAVVDQHQTLAETKSRMLHPKDKDMTELDRNTMLDAHIAVIRRDYELLLRIEKLIHERIELGKVFLQLSS